MAAAAEAERPGLVREGNGIPYKQRLELLNLVSVSFSRSDCTTGFFNWDLMACIHMETKSGSQAKKGQWSEWSWSWKRQVERDYSKAGTSKRGAQIDKI
ncbi:uncharacterized protein LOC144507962 isoform X2 [Mustelus asterias]